MEEIKYRLGDYKYYFFKNLQNYLDTELLFYGSIKRKDFFENASDVDITIINDNVSSILSKLTNYLHIDKSNIKKIYQKFTEKSTILVSGYKVKYDNKENNIVFDILVYDEKYRNIVLQNIDDINKLPLYVVFVLYIIKINYYILHLMSKKTYLYLKNCIFYMYFNKKISVYDKNKITTIILDNF